MKALRCVLICLGLFIGLASVCMAEDWYVAMERSSNDYRGSVGSMVTETGGAEHEARYTNAELQATRVIANARQFAPMGAAVAQASVSVAAEALEESMVPASQGGPPE